VVAVDKPERHPEFGCDRIELLGQFRYVDGIVGADELGAQEEGLASGVVELLMFGDVAVPRNRNELTACTMPGRCGQLSVRVKFWVTMSPGLRGWGVQSALCGGHDRIFFISGSTSGSATTVAAMRRSKY
jgi:hypothetical protein